MRRFNNKGLKTISAIKCLIKIGVLSWLGVLATKSQVQAAITTVDTIAALQGVNPATYDTVQVVDYYSSASMSYLDRGRGGGLFKWVTYLPLPSGATYASVHDGGRYITSSTTTNGIWERQFQGDTPNVKMWGAKGNGTTDDTLSIQRAMSSIRGVSIIGANRAMGNAMLFPAGRYLISDTIEIFSGAHISGEGSMNSTEIIMSGSVLNKDIFRTADATRYQVGGLISNGDGTMQNSASQHVDLSTGLLIEKLALWFGMSVEEYSRSTFTGAGIVLTGPNETCAIRNVYILGGAYGVRVLAGGTPGLKADNLGLFYQSVAGIQVEGPQFTSGVVEGNAGPMTLNSISGDSFYEGQAAQNSLILFSNCAPNVTINDISAEGKYGKGIVRCIVPDDNGSSVFYSSIAIKGGTVSMGVFGSIEQNLVVLENYSSSATKMPLITVDAVRLYGVANVIWDKWQGRKIPSATYYNQMPVRRPLYYSSAVTAGTEKRSLMVVGDTAYYSFIPTNIGWYRIAQNYGSDQVIGGRLAINTYWDSHELSFNLFPLSSDIQVLRKTKASSSSGVTNIVTHARGYCYWVSGYNQGLDIYVASIPHNSWQTELRYVTVTLPLEGRSEIGSGVSQLRDPLFTGSTLTNSYPSPAISGETYSFGGNTPTGPVSLLR